MCKAYSYFYFKRSSSSYITLLLYVDDMLVAGSDMAYINKVKKQLSRKFEMKDFGTAKNIHVIKTYRRILNTYLRRSKFIRY